MAQADRDTEQAGPGFPASRGRWMTMAGQRDDRARGLSEWDVQRAARFPDAEDRYDHGLPARDDIDQSLYLEFAAGDQATERLVNLARAAKAKADTRRNARRPEAETPDMEAEAG
jgi:hypothetical protein